MACVISAMDSVNFIIRHDDAKNSNSHRSNRIPGSEMLAKYGSPMMWIRLFWSRTTTHTPFDRRIADREGLGGVCSLGICFHHRTGFYPRFLLQDICEKPLSAVRQKRCLHDADARVQREVCVRTGSGSDRANAGHIRKKNIMKATWNGATISRKQ